jgi:hypothetical protein
MMAGQLSLADYLRSWRMPLVFAAFAKDDLVPGLIDLPLAVARVGVLADRPRIRRAALFQRRQAGPDVLFVEKAVALDSHPPDPRQRGPGNPVLGQIPRAQHSLPAG